MAKPHACYSAEHHATERFHLSPRYGGTSAKGRLTHIKTPRALATKGVTVATKEKPTLWKLAEVTIIPSRVRQVAHLRLMAGAQTTDRRAGTAIPTSLHRRHAFTRAHPTGSGSACAVHTLVVFTIGSLQMRIRNRHVDTAGSAGHLQPRYCIP